jgi:CRISPR-associated protein Csx14
MAEASIPVDLLNPGQVVACLGFLEAADALLGDAEGGFDWSTESDVRFRLRAAGEENPFEVVLEFLAGVTLESLAPIGSPNGTEKWGITTTSPALEEPFPYPDPRSSQDLPALLRGTDATTSGTVDCLLIDHWADTDATGRDRFKLWGGSAGYPGVAILRDALELFRERWRDAVTNPFAFTAPQSGSFRFDWRRDYTAIDIGFSLNRHDWLSPAGYPIVEVLAALGLGSARPYRESKLEYRYGVLGAPGKPSCSLSGRLLPPFFLRAALGCAPHLLPSANYRQFRMHLNWAGQAGQARVITHVYEETLHATPAVRPG